MLGHKLKMYGQTRAASTSRGNDIPNVLVLTSETYTPNDLNNSVQTVQERYRHTMLWRQGLDNAAGDQTPWGTDLDTRGRRSVPP